jgi:hypothetical protein
VAPFARSDNWRRYNQLRPHSSLQYLPPLESKRQHRPSPNRAVLREMAGVTVGKSLGRLSPGNNLVGVPLEAHGRKDECSEQGPER